MKIGKAIVSLFALFCVSLLISSAFAEPKPEPKQKIEEAAFTGEFILVNTKTIPAGFFLKKFKLVTIGGKAFLRGEGANIGDDGPTNSGIIISLAIDDIVAFREFSRAQAKDYYDESFRE
jgi:hypothetical protein